MNNETVTAFTEIFFPTIESELFDNETTSSTTPGTKLETNGDLTVTNESPSSPPLEVSLFTSH